MVISKFRPEYWIRVGISFLGLFLFIGFMFYFSFKDEILEIGNASLWIACLGAILATSYFLRFLFAEIRQITVDENSITIKYLISKKSNSIFHHEIKKFHITHEATTLDGAPLTNGYHNLHIELYNGDTFELDEDQYSNFLEIRAELYKHRPYL